MLKSKWDSHMDALIEKSVQKLEEMKNTKEDLETEFEKLELLTAQDEEIKNSLRRISTNLTDELSKQTQIKYDLETELSRLHEDLNDLKETVKKQEEESLGYEETFANQLSGVKIQNSTNQMKRNTDNENQNQHISILVKENLLLTEQYRLKAQQLEAYRVINTHILILIK
jgi:hypothetical protein